MSVETETRAAYTKPLPEIEPEAKPYWESLKEHAMKIQRCADCSRWIFAPRTICPGCMSSNLVWTPVSGRGTVYSTCNFHHGFTPGYTKEDLPYNLSIIELEEGARMMSNVIGVPTSEVKIGTPVEVVYDDVTDEITLAKFRPV
jgi:uncharacterized OB-fold protein